MHPATGPVCNALIGKAFVKNVVVTDLILVHVLVVDLERVGRQFLRLEQLPVRGGGEGEKAREEVG